MGVVDSMKGLASTGLSVLGFATEGNEETNTFGILMSAGTLAATYLGEAGEGSSTLSKKARALSQKVSKAQQIGTIAYCAFDVFTNPQAFMNVLGMLMENLGAAIANLISTVLEAVTIQITAAISNILSTVSNLISAVLKLATSILKLMKGLLDIYNNWFIKGASWRESRISTQYCEQLIATILACMLNKILGDPIEELKNKLVKRVNEVGGSINAAIQDNLEDTQILTNFIDHEAHLVGTAAAQVQGYADSMKAQAEAYALQEKAKEANNKVNDKNETQKTEKQNAPNYAKKVSATSNNDSTKKEAEKPKDSATEKGKQQEQPKESQRYVPNNIPSLAGSGALTSGNPMANPPKQQSNTSISKPFYGPGNGGIGFG